MTITPVQRFRDERVTETERCGRKGVGSSGTDATIIAVVESSSF